MSWTPDGYVQRAGSALVSIVVAGGVGFVTGAVGRVGAVGTGCVGAGCVGVGSGAGSVGAGVVVVGGGVLVGGAVEQGHGKLSQ